MLWIFFLLVASLNLCLGFALALLLGYGPQSHRQDPLDMSDTLLDESASEADLVSHPAREDEIPDSPSLPSPQDLLSELAPAGSTSSEPPARPIPPAAESAVPHSPATDEAHGPQPVPETAEQSAAVDHDPEPTAGSKESTADPPLHDVDESTPTPDPADVEEESSSDETVRPRGNVEASVDEVMAGLADFRAQLSTLNSKVRSCAKDPDKREVEACVKQFQHANGAYLASTQKAATRLDESQSDSEEMERIRRNVIKAVDAQTEQVKRTDDKLSKWDRKQDAAESCQTLLDDTQQLTDSTATLREDLEESRTAIARSEGWIDQVDQDLQFDPMTEVASRTAFASALERHLHEDPDRQRDLAVALIDIDHCRRVNRDHGIDVADEILKAVAKILAASAQDDQLIGRFGGESFSIMLPDTNAEDATVVVERMRQLVEETTFRCDGEPVKVTVSCAVSCSLPSDTVPSLMIRLQESLREAKRYGRNRTFSHNGQFPEPVVSPNIEVAGQTFDLPVKS